MYCLNAHICKALQLAIRRHSVSVSIHPQFKAVKHFILCINHAIFVSIVLCKCLKAILCSCTVCKQVVVTKDFTSVINLTVTILVQCKNCITSCPVDSLRKSVAVKVKICPCLLLFDVETITVKIKDDRVCYGFLGSSIVFINLFQISTKHVTYCKIILTNCFTDILNNSFLKFNCAIIHLHCIIDFVCRYTILWYRTY